MAIRGQRFHIDLDSDDETEPQKPAAKARQAGYLFNLVKDVQERVPGAAEARPPSPPRLKSSATGFPAHRKRDRPSVFKQGVGKKPTSDGITQTVNHSNAANGISQGFSKPNASSIVPPVGPAVGQGEDGKTERQRISDENNQKLAQMSEAEIVEARQELMSGLNPSIIEALLKKANIDDRPTDPEPKSIPTPTEDPLTKPKPPKKTVTFKDPEPILPPSTQHQPPSPTNPSAQPEPTPSDHFAHEALDPSSPSFLSSLHARYFPNLPTNPATLAWTSPLPPSDPSNTPYSPAASSLPASAVRFDFRGHLLPPRLSAQIPPTMGLHHHSSAPGSAGYTIAELGHLARSTFPSQRCIAMQTLGRVLYRLGRGDFGREVADEVGKEGDVDEEGGEDEDGEEGGEALCEALWNEVAKERIHDILMEAAGENGEKGNRSVWVIATEAVWLWQKGGGRTLK